MENIKDELSRLQFQKPKLKIICSHVGMKLEIWVIKKMLMKICS